jgi:hypothetical protein
MATHDSGLSDLSEMLVATNATLSTSLAELLTVAIEELIEAQPSGRNPRRDSESGRVTREIAAVMGQSASSILNAALS